MKKILFCCVLFGCGVEKGGKTTSLPVQPSPESLQKKEYAIDPTGFSSGRFVFAAPLSTGVTTVDSAGNMYLIFRYLFQYDTEIRYVPVAIKFAPDGTVVQDFDAVGNFQQVHGDWLLDPRDLTVSAEGKLVLLGDTQDTHFYDAKTTGTTVVSFTAEGYMNSPFGTSGVVRSTETSYSTVHASGARIYVGGSSAIRRLAAADGASDKPYGKSGDITADLFSTFAVSPDDILVSALGQRYDPTGMKTEAFAGMTATTPIGFDSKLNGFLFFNSSANEMELAGVDGKKIESFGSGGKAALAWLAGRDSMRFSVVNGRVLAYVAFGATRGFSVFNTDGTPIPGFGEGTTNFCTLTGKGAFRLQLLPTGNVLVLDNDDDLKGRIRHLGPGCQEVSVN